MTFAARVQSILETRGWTRRQLARVAGLRSESHIGHLLRGDDPRLSTVVAIAHAADVTVGWLAADEGAPKTKRPDTRALAAKVARDGGIDLRAIDLILSQPDDPQKTTLAWLDEMRLAGFAIRSAAPIAPPDRDEPRVKLARKGTKR